MKQQHSPSFRHAPFSTWLSRIITTLVVVMLCFSQSAPTFAATGINRQLTYQAKLLDSTGAAVSDGTYAVKFSIYDASSGGTRLWSASGTTATPLALNVVVANGLFTVYLGDTSVAGGTQNPLDDTILWNTDNLYLGVTIAADAEMTPRKRLSASPYAFNTERLQGMFASSSNVFGGSSLFTLNQASNTAATATRTALDVRSQGTSNANDFLIRATNDLGTPVFTVNRQGNVTATNAVLSDVSSTNLFATNASATTLNANTSTIANLNSINAFGQNATFTNLNTSNFNPTNITWTNGTGTNTTSTNLFATTASSSNLFAATSSLGAANVTNLFGQNATLTNATVTTLSVNTLNPTNLTWTNATGTNTTSTNLFATTASATTLNANTSTIANLNSINSFSQGSTSTNLFATTASATTMTALNLNSNNATILGGSINGTVIGNITPSTGVFTNATTTAVTSTNLFATTASATTFNVVNLLAVNATTTNATTTNLTVTGANTTTFAAGVSSTAGNFLSYVMVGGRLVCLSDGTNCTPAVDTNWTFNAANGFVRPATATNDVVIGGIATSSGAVAYYETRGDTVGSSTVYFGFNTSTDLVVGTNTNLIAGMHPSFALNGNDIYAEGNIGAASSVFTNGAFVAGTGTTYYSDGQIKKTNGNFLFDVSGNVIAPVTDDITALGSSTSRFRGNFSLTTSTAATATNLFATTASATNLTALNLNTNFATASQVTTTNLFATMASSSNLFAATSSLGAANVTNLFGQSATFTNATATTLFAATASATTLTALNLNTNNATILGGTALLSSSTITNLTWTNATGTNTTSSNLFATTASATSLTALNLNTNFATASQVTTTNLFATTASATTFNANTSTIANLNSINAFSQGSTSTNLFAGTASATTMTALSLTTNNATILAGTAILTSSTISNLSWNNATGTNTTSTNLFATTASATTLTALNLNANFATASQVTTTNLFATNASATNVNILTSTSGLSYVYGLLQVGPAGLTDLQSNVNLGNDSGDKIRFNGLAQTSLSPDVSDLYSLGSSTNEWANLYAKFVSSTTISTNALFATSTTSTFSSVGTSTIQVLATSNTTHVVGSIDQTVTGGTVYHTMSSTTSDISAIIPHGKVVYVISAGNGSVDVMDVSDKSHVTQVFSVAAGGPLDGVISGNWLFTRNVGTIRVFDISSSTRPLLIGTNVMGFSMQDMVASGKYLYVTDSSNDRMVVLDASSSTNVHVLGTASGSLSGPHGIEYANGKVYVASRTNDRLEVFDVSNPTSPFLLGFVSTGVGSAPVTVKVNQDVAYVTMDGTPDQGIFSVVDSANPVRIATTTLGTAVLPDNMENSVLQGRYWYITDSIGILDTIDVSSSTNPIIVNTTTTAETNEALAIDGRYAYLGTNFFTVDDLGGVETVALHSQSLDTYRLDVAKDAHIRGTLGVEEGLRVGNAGIYVDGAIAVRGPTTSTFGGVISVEGKTTSTFTGSASFLDNVYVGTSTYGGGLNPLFSVNGDDLYVDGNIGSASSVYTNGAFVAGNGTTMYGNGFINSNNNLVISSPTSGISFVGSVSNLFSTSTLVLPTATSITAVSPYGIAVDGKYMVVADVGSNVNTLRVYDVTNPESPSLQRQFSLSNNKAKYVTISGRYAYARTDGSDDNKFLVVDLYATSGPMIVASSTIPGSANVAYGLAAHGSYVYQLDTNGLFVMDVSNPLNPREVNFTSGGVTGPFASIALRGKYAYITRNNVVGGVNVYDISDPLHPTLATSTVYGQTYGIAISGNYGYATVIGSDNLNVINIADPFNMTVATSVSLGGSCLVTGGEVWAAGRYVYVACPNSSEVRIFDVAIPSSPVLLKTLTTFTAPQMPLVRGRYLYLTNDTGGSAAINVIKLPATEIANAEIHEVEAGNLTVNNDALISNDLSVGGGLQVGQGGLLVNGPSVLNTMFVASATATNLEVTGFVSTTALTVGGKSACLSDGTNCSIGQTWSASSSASTGVGAETEVLVVTSTPSFTSNQVWISADLKVVNSDVSTASNFTVRVRRGTNCTGGTQVGVDRSVTVPVSSSADISVGFVDAPNTTSPTGYRICVLGSGGTPTADNRSEVVQIVRAGTDLAEVYYSDDATLAPGEVVSADPSSYDKVARTASAYDRTVLGVVSTQPGSVLSDQPKASGTPILVALSGRVPVHVSVANGDIHLGDPLVASDIPGIAMKATRPGQVIGYALQDATTTGSIEMFVKVGFDASSVFTDVGLDLGPTSTASAVTTTVDSWGLTLRGSAWDSVSSTVISPQFTINNDVIDATNSQITIKNTSGTTVFALNQQGDLSVAGKLYPSRRGVAQSDYYLFVDDTLGPGTSTYIATNADGWQANDSYDFAERYYSPDHLDSGDVVVMSHAGQFHVQRAASTTVMTMGIVSTRPAFVAGRPATDTYPIALSGRVPTKVSTMNGPIHVGDVLGPSSIPGVAVKVTGVGPMVGMALEDYAGQDVGLIEVFVQAGWYGGENGATQLAQAVATSTTTTQPNVILQNTVTSTDPSTLIRQGFATLAPGDKKVSVVFDSVHTYPLIHITPYSEVQSWWLSDLSDVGFTINVGQSYDRVTKFAWEVQGTANGDMVYQSNGTTAPVDYVTGQTLGGQAVTTTAPASTTPAATTTETTMVTSVPVDSAPVAGVTTTTTMVTSTTLIATTTDIIATTTPNIVTSTTPTINPTTSTASVTNTSVMTPTDPLAMPTSVTTTSTSVTDAPTSTVSTTTTP